MVAFDRSIATGPKQRFFVLYAEDSAGSVFVTDGLGRILQESATPDPSRELAIKQFGYDSAGHRVWEALLRPKTGMPDQPYKKPSSADPNILAYAEMEYDLSGRVVVRRSYVIETQEVLNRPGFSGDSVS